MTNDFSKFMSTNLVQIEKPQTREVVKRDDGNELLSDLEQARVDIKEIAAVGIQAVAEAASLASASQHDKLYMALSSVMKSTLEANRGLIDVHRSRQELTHEQEPDRNITNNLIFNGSTAELLEILEKKDK
jgi:hypothetical protein